jgi:hypothetical protein
LASGGIAAATALPAAGVLATAAVLAAVFPDFWQAATSAQAIKA